MESEKEHSEEDEFGNNLIENLGPEIYDGNTEYKLKITDLDQEKLIKRMTQMKFRVEEGCGEAIYYIGVSDDGKALGLNQKEYDESVSNLKLMASKLEYSVTKLVETNNGSFVGEYLVREHDTNKYIDLKIGVAGNVDAGKSTTIGTLTKGILDDGKGRARLHVFNFKHEIDSGRTSSIGHQIMGFDMNGEVVNNKMDRQPTWEEIVHQSTKIVTFYDLAGHEDYLRTTIYGLTSICPDYCIIMVEAKNMLENQTVNNDNKYATTDSSGINHMTREHIGLCLALKIPFIIVVSKIDQTPPEMLETNISKINELCRHNIMKIPYTIKNEKDVLNVTKNIKSDSIVPILQISNVTGYGLNLLRMLLNLLPVRIDYSECANEPVELLVDNTYAVHGHPTIVGGMLRSGTIHVGDMLAIGPYVDGSYKDVKVKSIHCKYNSINEAKPGTYICVSLKNLLRTEVTKGMVVVTNIPECKIAVKEFWTTIKILHSPTTIKVGYQPYLHINHIRQTAKIMEIVKAKKPQNDEENVLRSKDVANIKLQFVNKPEYVKPNMRLIFRERNVKAIGKIIQDPS